MAGATSTASVINQWRTITPSFINIKGWPRTLLNIANVSPTWVMTYRIFGRIGTDGFWSTNPIIGPTGVNASTCVQETLTDGWDYLNVECRLSASDAVVINASAAVEYKGGSL